MTELKADKGLQNGSCNLTACQKAGANYFNKSTRAYYCKECADKINWVGGRKDTMRLYGVPLLCEYVDPNPSKLEPWQPMNTAPKDGTTFLARYGQDGVSIARFNNNKPDSPLEFIDLNDDGSFLVNYSKVGEYCIASHWMPLPQ